MKRLSWCLAVAMGVALVGVGSLEAAKNVKVKERKGQISYTFKNETGAAAYGLVVVLSDDAIVVKDDDDRAGPFGNIDANDTSKITLSNPNEPVAVSDSFSLTFQSYSKSFQIKQWWWLDKDGKRLGNKNKG